MVKKKVKTSYFCQNCGVESPKWVGKCPSCGEWNTFVEEVVQKEDKSLSNSGFSSKRKSELKSLNEISSEREPRMALPDIELNRVLGGGIVPGSVILLGGEPGIGKSTLLLQIALKMNKQDVIYVSGEESEQQIKMRAERIGIYNENCYILTETSTQNIFQHLSRVEPELLIIDSIQTQVGS